MLVGNKGALRASCCQPSLRFPQTFLDALHFGGLARFHLARFYVGMTCGMNRVRQVPPCNLADSLICPAVKVLAIMFATVELPATAQRGEKGEEERKGRRERGRESL